MRLKMLEVLLLIVSLMISIDVNATDAVDINGIEPIYAKKIINKYARKVAEIESLLEAENTKIRPGDTYSKSTEDIIKKRLSLIEKITQENGFLFVDFQTIHYPSGDKVYTTIEIVDKKHPERMRFVNTAPVGGNIEKKDSHRPDLIDAMVNYTNTGIELIIHHQISPTPLCPVYHCVAGFTHPKLNPYLDIFNQGAIKEKKLIINTLNHDPNPERRAAAAFLVGHFKDPHEIVIVLSPHVTDKSDAVRNNVIRVIAKTIVKAKITNLNVTPFLNALDSPYNTDRNKALYVLLYEANANASKKLILQKGGDKILSLMQLKQPNNHDPAYDLLKKISGKDFGSTNLRAWKNWIYSTKNKVT